MPSQPESHFGIYAVIVQDGKLLCVRKQRGHYDGLLDLPGGTPEKGETQDETLKRELAEETGATELSHGEWNPLDFHVDRNSKGSAIDYHHRGVWRRSEVTGVRHDLKPLEDVAGLAWVELAGVDGRTDLSPLVRQVLARILPASPALTFLKAELAQAPQVLSLLQATARWLRARGINQWVEFADGGGEHIVERRFKEGEVYLFNLDQRTVGTLTLQTEDSFWDEMGRDGKALWIHSICVEPGLTGHSIGSRALSWVLGKARDEGKAFVRLDCWAQNAGLCHYYESFGFREIGRKKWKDRELKFYEISAGGPPAGPQ